jgi:hypothetical protein
MVCKRGRVTYVPRPLFELADDLRIRKGITKQKDAFNEMVKYARVGIEAENLHDLFFPVRKKKNRGL